MLILARKIGESLMIGDDIEITICEFRRDNVRIGINAPKHVAIHRKEIWAAIQRGEDDTKAQKGDSC